MNASQRARRDYQWSKMSLFERSEWLRAEVDALEESLLDGITAEPGWSVSEVELARLRRIEEAARGLVVDWALREERLRALRKLRDALDSEPER